MAKTTKDEIDELRSMIQGGDSALGKLKSLTGDLSTKVGQLWDNVFGGKGKMPVMLSNSDTIRGTAVYAHSEGAEPNVDATGAGMSGYPVTFGTVDMHLFVTNDGVLTFGADTSGNVRSGSNASEPATTAWAVFSIDQTYNSESMGAGDMLLGDNTTSKANILWDASEGQLKFRSGTTTKAYIDTDGTLVSTDAEIGGWTIDSTTIQKLTASVGIILDSANRVIKVGDTSGVHIQIDGGNQRLRSSNFVTGQSGFNISAATGDAEFNNVTARGNFKTAVFEKDTISVVGGNMLILPGDSLASDMTALDSSTLTVLGETTFAVGDILRMKDGTDDEWLEVTSIASAPTYAVTRDKASAYASNSNPVWKKGQAVANYMQSGDGGVIIQSGTTPKISCFTHAGSPWTTITEQSYMSELGNIAGAGAVMLDANGITIATSEEVDDSFSSVKWKDITNSVLGASISIRRASGSDATNYSNIVYIRSFSNGTKSNDGAIYLEAGADASIYLATNSITTEGPLTINALSADVDTIIKGNGGITATFDAGLLALGVGGAAESGYKLKVTGKAKTTNDMDVASGLNVGSSTGAGVGDVYGSGELIMAGAGASSVGGAFTVGVAGFNHIVKTTDENKKSDTTLATDSALTVTLTASKTYAVRGRVWFDTPAAADFKYSITFAGTTLYCKHTYYPAGSSTGTTAIAAATPASATVLGTGTTAGMVEFDALCVVDGSNRAFNFQWAQNTSTASNTTVRAGSYIEYCQMA